MSHLLSDPDSWDIVHIAIHREDLCSLFSKMLDIRARPRESTILILRLPIEDDLVSRVILSQDHPTIPPDDFGIHPISIRNDGFDHEFFISRLFFGEELDPTSDRLLLSDGHEREAITEITLVLDSTRQE